MPSAEDADTVQRGVGWNIHALMAGMTGLMVTGTVVNAHYLGLSAPETQQFAALVFMSIVGWGMVVFANRLAPKVEEVLTA